MNTRCIILAGYILISAMPILRAQSSDALKGIPPPQAPLVAPIPRSAQWTITLAYEADDQDQPKGSPVKPSHRIDHIASTKTQNLKREIDIYDDGTRTTNWFQGSLILLADPTGQNVRMIDFAKANRERGEVGNPISSPGFAGMDWVQLKYYDKVVLQQNVPCYHYVLGTENAGGIEAWINAMTGFPVAYRTGGITYTYAFGSTPDSELELPENYAKALKGYQKIENQRKQLEKDLGG